MLSPSPGIERPDSRERRRQRGVGSRTGVPRIAQVRLGRRPRWAGVAHVPGGTVGARRSVGRRRHRRVGGRRGVLGPSGRVQRTGVARVRGVASACVPGARVRGRRSRFDPRRRPAPTQRQNPVPRRREHPTRHLRATPVRSRPRGQPTALRVPYSAIAAASDGATAGACATLFHWAGRDAIAGDCSFGASVTASPPSRGPPDDGSGAA